MEKLIKLLNEYEKDGVNEFETYVERWYCERTYQILSGKWENSNELKPCEIISKRYGFIKWLVEKDKINIKALVVKGEMRSGWDFDNKKGNEESGEEIWNKYFSELCLMILAIQDEPIDFLISVLK